MQLLVALDEAQLLERVDLGGDKVEFGSGQDSGLLGVLGLEESTVEDVFALNFLELALEKRGTLSLLDAKIAEEGLLRTLRSKQSLRLERGPDAVLVGCHLEQPIHKLTH